MVETAALANPDWGREALQVVRSAHINRRLAPHMADLNRDVQENRRVMDDAMQLVVATQAALNLPAEPGAAKPASAAPEGDATPSPRRSRGPSM